MIALMGLDAETGVFMLLFLDLSYNDAVRKGKMRNYEDLREAIIHGAVKRVRPKAMTVMAAMMGLLPIMWSMGIGADVMKRIAAPMIAGLVTSFSMELLVYPVIYALWKWRSEVRPTSRARLQLREVLVGVLLDRVFAAGATQEDRLALDRDLDRFAHRAEPFAANGTDSLPLGDRAIFDRKLGESRNIVGLVGGGICATFVLPAVRSRRGSGFSLIWRAGRTAAAGQNRCPAHDNQAKQELAQVSIEFHFPIPPERI